MEQDCCAKKYKSLLKLKLFTLFSISTIIHPTILSSKAIAQISNIDGEYLIGSTEIKTTNFSKYESDKSQVNDEIINYSASHSQLDAELINHENSVSEIQSNSTSTKNRTEESEAYPLFSEIKQSSIDNKHQQSAVRFTISNPNKLESIEKPEQSTNRRSSFNVLQKIDTSTTPNFSNYPLVQQLSDSSKPDKNKEEAKISIEDNKFKKSPRQIPKKSANPFATTIPLNDVFISHLTEWEIVGGYNFGDSINNNYQFDAIVNLGSKIEQSLTKDNLFTIDQRGSYLQTRNVTNKREIITSRKLPRTLFGFQLQMSLTGACFFPGTNFGQQCSYTPAIETDEASTQPDTLLPTDLTFSGEVGELVTPESIEAIRQPGFQRGANGQDIGVDFLYPNVSSRAGNSQTNQISVEREEIIERSPALAFSRVRQIVQSNDKETVIARTVRGTAGILNDKNALLNLGVQVGAELLPDIKPKLEGSNNPANRRINRNLFLAANNVRVPANSFTIYHGGIGRAAALKTKPSNPINLPAVSFNSVWIGLSPVIKRSISKDLRYETIGSPRITSSAGNEGGADDKVSFLSVVDGQVFSSEELENFYSQIYLTNFETDANLVARRIFTEKTNYYPHLSWTGDISKSNQTFRYYTGIIASPKIKAYAGLDYNRISRDGWRYGISGIGYINPDRDYYSHIQGNVSKRIGTNRNSNLTLSTGFKWEIDRADRIGELTATSKASLVRVGAQANLGILSLGVENYFGSILPDSTAHTLKLNVGIKFSDRFRVSGFFTPINKNSSRTNYGATASLRLGNGRNSPSLITTWRNNEYDFGQDSSGKDLVTKDNVFTILFRWGKPSNPLKYKRPRRK